MDIRRFDRFRKTLLAGMPRRDAVMALTAAGGAALGARFGFEETATGKKKRCRKRRQPCGGKKKCCGKNTACREFPTANCLTLSGRRCCGLEGAPCDNDPSINNCDYCDGLFCGGLSGQPGRCQEEPA